MLEIRIMLDASPVIAAAIQSLAQTFAGHPMPVTQPVAQPVTQAQATPVTQPVTVAQAQPVLVQKQAVKPKYTMDHLVQAGATLMDSGRINELQALLARFQVRGVLELNPGQFDAFADALRELGATI